MTKLSILVLVALLAMTACSSTYTPEPSLPNTPTQTLEATPSSKYSADEAISLVENYLLAQAKTRLAQDVVQTVMTYLQGSYQGEGVWEISGYGQWKVYEASGNVQPVDVKARDVLKSIADANNPPPAKETPTPTPTPSPTPSITTAIETVRPAVVRVETESGNGSGIIIDKAGYVLTNSHVVKGDQTATVVLTDGSQLPASIIGRDEVKDLAILKITRVNLPVATLGKSGDLKAGGEVIAVGFPLSLGGTATASSGIVSAFRDDGEAGVTYIQTDVAMNPGNSGGPLINLKGEVVGINTWVIRTSSQMVIEGMNFAIAIDSAKAVIPMLIAGQSVLKPTPEPEAWKTYTNQADGYSIEYPGSWEAQEFTDNLANASCNIHVNPLKTGAPGANIEVFINPTTLKQRTGLNSRVDSTIKFQRESNFYFEVILDREITFGGFEARETLWTYQYKEMYAKTKARSIWLISEGRIYELRCSTQYDDFNFYSATFDRALSSFNLTNPQPPEQPWKTYTNQSYGYSVEYRGDWTIKNPDQESVSLFMTSSGFIQVRAEAPLQTWTLTYYVNWLIDYMRNNRDGFSLISSKNIIHQSKDAWELIYSSKFTGKTYKQKELIVPTSVHLYRIAASTLPEDYEALSSQIDRSLSSFRFVNP